MQKLKKGFTLIELLVVIAIIAVLATIVILNVASARGKSNNAKTLADMVAAQKTASQCVAEDGIIWYNGAAAVPRTPAVAIAFVINTAICSTTLVPGNWPALGLRATNNVIWAPGTTQLTTTAGLPLDFAVYALAQAGAAPAANDFRVKCTATGCAKEQGAAYGTTAVTW
jgi:prepilin-type N-terminal cleavage/methylation domain-containing protein